MKHEEHSLKFFELRLVATKKPTSFLNREERSAPICTCFWGVIFGIYVWCNSVKKNSVAALRWLKNFSD